MPLRFRPHLATALFIAGSFVLPALEASAQEDESEAYKPQLPDVSIYKAMLDANKQTGWIQFREFSGQQLVYFTALQTMHCRLSEVRYSINSDELDKSFPMAKCNPQLPFSLPADDTAEYVYISLKPGEAETIAVQAVWDDGSGSEIVVYQPCKDVGDASCATIRTIKKSKTQGDAPTPSTEAR